MAMPTQKSSAGGPCPPQTPGQSCDPQTRPQGRALSLRLPERVVTHRYHARAAFLPCSSTWGLVITAETERPMAQHRGTGRED